MNELVQINFHGELGKVFGKRWNLAVSSVSEAIRAINILTNNRFNRFLKKKDKLNAVYRVLINSEDFICEKRLDKIENVESVFSSNLVVNMPNLKSIDIIPCLDGASDILNVILGAILIVVGVFTFGITTPLGFSLAIIGAGLAISGIVGLLSKPPGFEDKNSVRSYLFDGPSQTTGEGGPVPHGYGRLLIGPQVVSAAYQVYDVITADGNTSRLPITDITIYNPSPAPTNVATSAFPQYVVTLSCSSNGKIHYIVNFSSTPPDKSTFVIAESVGSPSAEQRAQVQLLKPANVGDYVYIHMYCTYRWEMSSASTKIYTYAYRRV